MIIDPSQTVPPGPPPGAAPAGTTGTIAEKDRQLAVAMHLSALVGYVVPFANLIIPLVIWLTKKDESPDIDAVGREVLNFNISMLIYAVAGVILAVVLIGFLLLLALWVFGIVVTIVAAVRANDGWRYHYPATIRFL
jgi:uncharacterized Tic20 family protein